MRKPLIGEKYILTEEDNIVVTILNRKDCPNYDEWGVYYIEQYSRKVGTSLDNFFNYQKAIPVSPLVLVLYDSTSR